MHDGSYNRNLSRKIVRLTIRKNILLNLKNCLQSGNCMLDDDVPLMSRDYLEESAALNASLVSNEENMGDDDSFDDNIEMDNIEELSTSTFIRIVCIRILCRIHC